jgi:hypothetical protein
MSLCLVGMHAALIQALIQGSDSSTGVAFRLKKVNCCTFVEDFSMSLHRRLYTGSFDAV